MKTRMEVNSTADYGADVAEFELTQEKLYRIMRLAQIVKEQEVYCLQEFDYSLMFFSWADYDEEELAPFGGRMDCCSLHVCSDRFYWTGYYKHSDVRWETDAVLIKDALDKLHGGEKE